MIYLTLFVSAFVSATLIPFGSEALLVYDILHGYSPLWIFIVATVGNTMGAAVNYWLGLGGEELLESRKLINPGSLQKPKKHFDRFGPLVLLFSWMPVAGDLFTFAAGVLRYPFWKFLLLVSVAKGGRYAVLIWVTSPFLI